ncbi:hypothetical protein SDC9_102449 [bioreactor metagenome]|uniref:Terminase large subunit gp17-like C-terminal domain-containing protein n=1 Tax=bioreactor metagenome TaxID=1076179 RepID=A0A645AQV9_9ZZZZ
MIRPVQLPEHWPRYRVFDYGLDMLACYWAAVDGQGRIWLYRELCRPGLIVSDAAAAILAATPAGERISYTIAPPDMWTTLKDTGRTMAELFTACGVPLVKASNARVQGWLMMKEFLKLRADGRPGLLVFDTCAQLLRSLPSLLHSELNPSDVATEPHELTHQADAVRYLCVHRTLGADGQEPAEEGREDFDQTLRGGAASPGYLYG